jgi:hypothetical protein
MFSMFLEELPIVGCAFGLMLKLMKLDGFGKV